MYKYIDLTHTIKDSMPVYGGDPKTNLFEVKNFEKDGYTLYRFETCLHAGTHIDIPMHLTKNDKFISDYPLEKFCGNAVVFNMDQSNDFGSIYGLSSSNFENTIVLLNTNNSTKYETNEYFDSYPLVPKTLASFLIDKKIRMLGLDTPSPDIFPYEIHKMLMINNIPIIENLANLHLLPLNTIFEIFAFPLKIQAEASLVRVVARVLA